MTDRTTLRGNATLARRWLRRTAAARAAAEQLLVQMAHTWFVRRRCGTGASRRYAMASNEPFGFDPDDLDRFFPGAGDQLRSALGQFARMLNAAGEGRARTRAFDELGRAGRAAPASETTGDTGEGVWMIYTVDADGDARVEQVYATELEALRVNKHNTDSNRPGPVPASMGSRLPSSMRRSRPACATGGSRPPWTCATSRDSVPIYGCATPVSGHVGSLPEDRESKGP